MVGQILSTKQVESSKGENLHQVNLNGLSAGIYLIQLISDNQTLDIVHVPVE